MKTETSDVEPSGGLVFQSDIPPTPELFIAKARRLGLRVQKSSRFGFRPVLDRSGAIPITEPGAPVVDALRELRERRRGLRPLNGAQLSGRAKELIERGEQLREAAGGSATDSASPRRAREI